jgi:hypothetical protein
VAWNGKPYCRFDGALEEACVLQLCGKEWGRWSVVRAAKRLCAQVAVSLLVFDCVCVCVCVCVHACVLVSACACMCLHAYLIRICGVCLCCRIPSHSLTRSLFTHTRWCG